MPYSSIAERKRLKWMTLGEAIYHIQRAEKCDENTALQQLLAALADGAVASSWALNEAALNVSGASKPIVGALERRQFWLSRCSISLERRTLTDAEDADFEDDELGAIPPRSIEDVWVLKEAILEHWTDGAPERAPKNEPQASKDEIVCALRDVFEDIEKEKKRWDVNLLHRWVQERVDPKRAPRKVVLRHFATTPEFRQHQRSRGAPRK
jgi:hypothetical protein